MTESTDSKPRSVDDGWKEYSRDGDTWWMDGDCPKCGHVVYANGSVRVCGEDITNCQWWEKSEAVGT